MTSSDEYEARIAQLELELTSANGQIVHLSGERERLAEVAANAERIVTQATNERNAAEQGLIAERERLAGAEAAWGVEHEAVEAFSERAHVADLDLTQARDRIAALTQRAERAEGSNNILMDDILKLDRRIDSLTDQLSSKNREVQVLVTAGITATERAERAEAAAEVDHQQITALTHAMRDAVATLGKVEQERDTLAAEAAKWKEDRRRLAHAIDPRSETDRLERTVESLEQWLKDEREGAKALLRLAETYRMERELQSERISQLIAENASLRNQLGDNLCWLDHSSTLLDAAKILPETEFLESCRRYHSQLAAERGVFTGGMTIAQLEQRIAQLEGALRALKEDYADSEGCYCGQIIGGTKDGVPLKICGYCKAEAALSAPVAQTNEETKTKA